MFAVAHAVWSKLGVWGAPARFFGPVRFVVVHHSVTAIVDEGLEDVRTVDKVIRRRGGFSMIPYSWVYPRGGVYEGRGWKWRNGANRDTKSSGIRNGNSISCCLAGNHHVDNRAPLDSQLDAIAAGVRLGRISPDFVVVPHRTVAATACPGDYTIPHIASIQTRAQELLTPMAETPFSKAVDEADYQDAIRRGFISSGNREGNASREMLGLVAQRVYNAGEKRAQSVAQAALDARAKLSVTIARQSATIAEQTKRIDALVSTLEALGDANDELTKRLDALAAPPPPSDTEGLLVIELDLAAVRNAVTAGIVSTGDITRISRVVA